MSDNVIVCIFVAIVVFVCTSGVAWAMGHHAGTKDFRVKTFGEGEDAIHVELNKENLDKLHKYARELAAEQANVTVGRTK